MVGSFGFTEEPGQSRLLLFAHIQTWKHLKVLVPENLSDCFLRHLWAIRWNLFVKSNCYERHMVQHRLVNQRPFLMPECKNLKIAQHSRCMEPAVTMTFENVSVLPLNSLLYVNTKCWIQKHWKGSWRKTYACKTFFLLKKINKTRMETKKHTNNGNSFFSIFITSMCNTL